MLDACNWDKPPRSIICGVAQAIGAHGAQCTIASELSIFNIVDLPLTLPFVRTPTLDAHNRARPPRSSIRGVAQAIGTHGAQRTIASKFSIFDLIDLPLTPPFVRTPTLDACNWAKPPRSSIRCVAQAIGARGTQRVIRGRFSNLVFMLPPLTPPFAGHPCCMPATGPGPTACGLAVLRRKLTPLVLSVK